MSTDDDAATLTLSASGPAIVESETECEAFAPETIARQLVEADSDADGERESRIEAGR